MRTVFLQQGGYWAVVAKSDREGFVRKIAVGGDMELPIVLSVDKWTKFNHNKDGTLKFERTEK